MYANDMKTLKCKGGETIIHKRRLLFAGAVQRTINERLTRRAMFETIIGGTNAGTWPTRNDLGPVPSQMALGSFKQQMVPRKYPRNR